MTRKEIVAKAEQALALLGEIEDDLYPKLKDGWKEVDQAWAATDHVVNVLRRLARMPKA